jgi:hypothetical protein
MLTNVIKRPRNKVRPEKKHVCDIFHVHSVVKEEEGLPSLEFQLCKCSTSNVKGNQDDVETERDTPVSGERRRFNLLGEKNMLCKKYRRGLSYCGI